MTGIIGLVMLILLAAGIVVMGQAQSGASKAFYTALARAGFTAPGQLPQEWQTDYAYLTPRQGLLMQGFPEAMIVSGHLQGTSVGTIHTLDLYLGYILPAGWPLSALQREKVTARIGADTARVSAAGDLLYLWKQPHTVARLSRMLDSARGHLLAVLTEYPPPPAAAKVTPPPLPVPETEVPLAPSAAQAPIATAQAEESKRPPGVFVDDNTWGWRKESNYGYDYLPDEAMQPDTRIIALYFHSLSTLPWDIGKLQKLESLTVFNAELKELPESIGQCRSLRELRFRQCRLISLPASLCDLENLEALELSFNSIKELPEDIGRLRSLKKLIVNCVPLTRLPDSIGELSQLEELGVACGRLNELPASIASLHQLKELVVSEMSKLSSELEHWKKVFPNAEVRVGSIIETTTIG